VTLASLQGRTKSSILGPFSEPYSPNDSDGFDGRVETHGGTQPYGPEASNITRQYLDGDDDGVACEELLP
jgi:hypothetical protein